MNTYDALVQAIKNKQQVIAVYKGLERHMCPHSLGTKNGKMHCMFYQYGGQSSSGTIAPGSDKNWRCIPIEGLSNILVQDGDWHTGNNHSRGNSCIDTVLVEVQY